MYIQIIKLEKKIWKHEVESGTSMEKKIIEELLIYMDCKKIKYANLIDKYKENIWDIKKRF